MLGYAAEGAANPTYISLLLPTPRLEPAGQSDDPGNQHQDEVAVFQVSKPPTDQANNDANDIEDGVFDQAGERVWLISHVVKVPSLHLRSILQLRVLAYAAEAAANPTYASVRSY